MSGLTGWIRRWAPAALVGLGLLWAAVSVLDPFRPTGGRFGPLLVLVALALRYRTRARLAPYVAAAVLVGAYSVSSRTLIEFRADSVSYFAYLHSTFFDRDFDFGNEWAHFGQDHANGRKRTRNVFSVGPAVVWSPFYLAAHLYVRLDRFLGRDFFSADGLSLPYMRSTALGTVTIVVLGAVLLTLMMARAWGRAVALLAVLGAVAGSPVLYYTFFVPAMAHGVAFGLAAALLWAWERARRRPSPGNWVALGAILGLLTAARWQAALYVVLVGSLAVFELTKNRVRVAWIVLSAAAAILAFSPQIVAWKIGFGEWLLMPQGRGFLDLSSPHWLDTLVSADHGFFNWTPLMFVGLVGLLAGLRQEPLLHGGGLVVLVLTAWVNGSVPYWDWAGGDAFGARRYCLVVPLVALGLGTALRGTSRLLARSPLLAPAAAMLLLVLWNLGLVSSFRARRYPGTAPLERLASDQAGRLRSAAEKTAEAIAGSRGRALVYDMLSGEYVYEALLPSGTLFLRNADERFLLRGWYTASRRIARRTFRRALYPEACVSLPLREPFPLRVGISACAPEGLERQSLALVVNGNRVGESPLGPDWREIPFLVDERHLVPGENEFCLRFSTGLPEKDGVSIAARVEKIQLP